MLLSSVREACLSLGLDNLAEICVYFPDALPVLCRSQRCALGNQSAFLSRLLFISLSLLLEEKGQQIVTLCAHAERIRNNIHSFRERTLVSAPGGISHRRGFYPQPRQDSAVAVQSAKGQI